MLSSRIKLAIVMFFILIILTACTGSDGIVTNNSKEDTIIEENPNYSNENSLRDQSVTILDNIDQVKYSPIDKYVDIILKSISQEEYDKWVVPMYDDGLDPNDQSLQLPEIKNFNYPQIEGMEDQKLQNKVNNTIKKAIFDKEFLSDRLYAVGIEITPYSQFDFPGIIYNNEILSIPIVLYWDRPHSNYKSISVTINMKTGERIFLEDIIQLNEDLAYRILYEEDFFINIDIVGTSMREDLINYTNGDKEIPNEASKKLLNILRGYAKEGEKPQVETYYLTKDGLVLTNFANNGIPAEINMPHKTLDEYLLIKSWESSEILQFPQ